LNISLYSIISLFSFLFEPEDPKLLEMPQELAMQLLEQEGDVAL
jgi:hypothetical protein